MSRLNPRLNQRDHRLGRLSAPVQLVEFGDYECPFCGESYLVVAALQETLADRMCYGFRHFPLTGSHPHALRAAHAAEAAGAQGRFWQMHRMLYENQDHLQVRDLERYAADIGLDLPRFVIDMGGRRAAQKLAEDRHSAALSGVNGTPTFFIQGRRHDGGHDFDSLLAALLGGDVVHTIA